MIHCYYHSGDHDGVCSAAIIKRKFPESILRPINYGDNYDEKMSFVNKDDTVIMVDFSIKPIKKMIKISKQCREFYWIDHHHDSISMAKNEGFEPLGVRVNGTAACILAWNFYFNDEKLPLGVKLLGNWDVRKLDQKTVLFHYGMDLYPLDPNLIIWKKIFENEEKTIDTILNSGTIISQFVKKEEIHLTTSSGFDIDFGGFKALAVNGYVDIDSAIESGIFNEKNHDFLLMFERKKEGWKFSLRTRRDDVDVSEIASRFKGGGHKKASGFETKDDNLITKMIKGKILITKQENN